MARVFFDASALAKRFVPEPGSDAVDRIFGAVPPWRMMCLMHGASEAVSVLVRRHNSGRLSDHLFTRAKNDVLYDVIHSGEFATLSVANSEIEESLLFLESHALNATDALVLRIALDVERAANPAGDSLILVASDERLLRAATSEGLSTFNPESQSEEDLAALLARS